MLSIRNIVKKYAEHTALDDVSIEVEKGCIFGLLGPNGAGKTSLIRIVNQITAPDSGEVFINEQRLSPSHIAQIGYLPEERGLYKKMEIGAQVIYLAQLKGLSKHEAQKRVKFWFEKMGMQSWWKKKVEDLSKGMQQKVQFVATVLHEPELLILDEPFTGFDPINVDIIKNEILELNRKGATVIFSTHRMESVEELCESIALINKSKKILDGKVSDVKDRYRSNTFHISYSGDLNGDLAQFSDKFTVLSDKDHRLKIKLDEHTGTNELLHLLLDKLTITGMQEVIPTMHDIFVKSVKEKQAEEVTTKQAVL